MRRIMQIAEFDSREETTIPDALLASVKLFGKKRPFIEDIRGKEETFGDVLKMTLALGRLTSKWTKEGERVGVLMPTATPTAGMIIGMMAMRRVPAMLNYTSGREGLENACQRRRDQDIFASRAFIEKAKLTAMMENFTAARVMYLEDLRKHFGIVDKLWLVLFALRFPKAAMKRSSPQDMAVVLFTSGSEGKPKGVALSHASILANCAQSRAVIEISHHDKFLNALPLFHSFGLVAGLMLPMVCGSRIFLYPSPLHYRVIPEIFYDRDCTVLFATSTFLGNYARFAHPYDFYKIRYVVSGAEKLSEEVRRFYFEKVGIRILEGYGATECSPIISVNTPFSCEPGSVGEPLPGIECQARAGGRNRNGRGIARARTERDDGIFSGERARRVAASEVAVRRGVVRHGRHRHDECAAAHHDSGAFEEIREGRRRNGVAGGGGADRGRGIAEADARVGRGEGRSARRIDRVVHGRSGFEARTIAGRGA